MNINRELLTILSTDVFRKIANNELIRVRQLNAAITLLIRARIPFDLTFSPGTRRAASAADLTIYVNPTTTINFTIAFETGGSIFTDTT